MYHRRCYIAGRLCMVKAGEFVRFSNFMEVFMSWDGMTGSVHDMERAYEREWAREWEALNEPIPDQSDDSEPDDAGR